MTGLVLQGDGYDCGPACVAMVVGCTLDEARAMMDGWEGGTSAEDLAHALRREGFEVPDRLCRRRGPGLNIGKVSWYENGVRARIGHWVVVDGPDVFDPYYGVNPKWVAYHFGSDIGCVVGRITSWLPVT